MRNKMKYAILYVAAIVAVNYGFSVIEPWFVFGAALPPMTFLVGAVFILRDYAQKDLGHYVWAPMAIGILLSYLMADPFIAIASALAFIVSEATDWAVYTKTKRPMKDRILLSSAISVPVDSLVFLVVAGFFGWTAFFVMVVSKMIASVIVWLSLK
tara:strand:- start:686 stop:1153 length:468 start_codon:yes stop_codon:yes gene_type:complete